ncbi:MAG: CTP synthase, partial [Candidatus Portnoybacteria bacterium CG10_big_fil_rev_8_21_14_0_10_36_7]
ERFLNTNIYSGNYMTTGRVYESVIHRERNLEYDGKCVEVVPHIPEEVIRRIQSAARKTKSDFVMIEIGGTIGEYQNMLFLEAARMIHLRHPQDVVFVLVSYLPVPSNIGEMKTKPTQYAVRTLNSAGIQPDIILARSHEAIDEVRKKKIAMFCNVDKEDIISAPDVKTIYEVPLNFERDKLSTRILNKVGMRPRKKNLADWKRLVNIITAKNKTIKIGIVGKYFQTGKFTLTDSYISVIEAVKHAVWYFRLNPEIVWLNAEEYEKNPDALKELAQYDGVIVPGGFGQRGVEGKILAIQYLRENNIPFLGLCLGMQLAIIEFARNVVGLANANSTEFTHIKGGGKKKGIVTHTPYPIIDIMQTQKSNIASAKYGGTMRLGSYACKLNKNSLVFNKVYKQSTITERHRHRYEFNSEYKKVLEDKGMLMSGINPETGLVEIIEIHDHPFFMASQFHPEFKTRPLEPHPMFREFIKNSIKQH